MVQNSCWRNPTWTTLGWYLLPTVTAVSSWRCLFLSTLAGLLLTRDQCHWCFISCSAVMWGSCTAFSAVCVIRDAVGGTLTGRCSQQQSCCNDGSKPVSWLLLSDGAVRVCALQRLPCASRHELMMRFHSVLLSALEFSWKGLSENFPFTKIYVKMMLCAVRWLLWVLSGNLWWPWAERLGRERKAWLGTVICSLPAAIQGKGHPREYGEKGSHHGMMSKQLVLLAPRGVILCCPHGMCPI